MNIKNQRFCLADLFNEWISNFHFQIFYYHILFVWCRFPNISRSFILCTWIFRLIFALLTSLRDYARKFIRARIYETMSNNQPLNLIEKAYRTKEFENRTDLFFNNLASFYMWLNCVLGMACWKYIFSYAYLRFYVTAWFCKIHSMVFF